MENNRIQHSKTLYKLKDKDEAYKYVHSNNLNIIEDEDLSFLHLEYCISNGYYEEALDLKNKFIEKYPNSQYINSINKFYPNNDYNKKAKKYNKNKRNNILEDCSYCGPEWCDCCDILVDCGKNDTGCVDIDLCCFFD